MGSETDRTQELEQTVHDLMKDVDRYRTATEDALQQIDWCIGYFTGCNKASIAKALSSNRAYIRKHILHREEQGMPTGSATNSGKAQS
jgi:hypothetical protein